MKDIKMRGADLKRADLREAELSGNYHDVITHYDEADLRGADLRGAEMRGVNLQDAIANTATLWPQGFNPEDCGIIIETE
jgi:uncharacterized protein YjbI with pentapeptide repeats